ncbi:hypothetical protein Tco_1219354 [Tanacetum coccineum]
MYPSHLVLIDPLKNIALKRQQYVGEFIGCDREIFGDMGCTGLYGGYILFGNMYMGGWVCWRLNLIWMVGEEVGLGVVDVDTLYKAGVF